MGKLSELQRAPSDESIDDLLARLRRQATLIADWHEPPAWLATDEHFQMLLEFEQEVLRTRRFFQRIDLR